VSIAMFFTDCASISVRGDYEQCEPDWYNNRPAGNDDIFYGVGVGKSKSRKDITTTAFTEAVREVLDKLKTNMILEIEANIAEDFVDVNSDDSDDSDEVDDFVERLKDNLALSLQGDCESCILIKFADCEVNNIWTAYVLVKFDVIQWKETKFREIAEEEYKNSTPALHSQSEKFKKRFNID
tara:strand:- start:1496 stop:2041 length:546 start_codon:yes stop_codon:yes gene_type:complete